MSPRLCIPLGRPGLGLEAASPVCSMPRNSPAPRRSQYRAAGHFFVTVMYSERKPCAVRRGRASRCVGPTLLSSTRRDTALLELGLCTGRPISGPLVSYVGRDTVTVKGRRSFRCDNFFSDRLNSGLNCPLYFCLHLLRDVRRHFSDLDYDGTERCARVGILISLACFCVSSWNRRCRALHFTVITVILRMRRSNVSAISKGLISTTSGDSLSVIYFTYYIPYYINTLKTTVTYIYHLIHESITRHFLFMGFVQFLE
jgi:hypothetical protein